MKIAEHVRTSRPALTCFLPFSARLMDLSSRALVRARYSLIRSFSTKYEELFNRIDVSLRIVNPKDTSCLKLKASEEKH